MAEFAWRDISIVMLGSAVIGARDISYTATQEKEHIHGTGDEPLGIARGQKSYEGSITLLQSEVKKIQNQLPKGSDLLDIQPFIIAVSYIRAGGAEIETDRIEGAEFTELPKGMGNEDRMMEVELPFIATKITYNV